METLTRAEMQRLTRHLPTKAQQIRALARAGVSVGDIGRFLGISYQHAYNVVKRSGISVGPDGVRDAVRVSAGAPARAVLDESGRIVVPQQILASWSASPGDELLIRLEGDELRVLTRDAGARLARGILRRYLQPGASMADELIEERRREAAASDA
jgi:bifunctional DNA-binding transcriptional regulator/antitoxin component of YhaV-PrlF toxin-antitoxin module